MLLIGNLTRKYIAHSSAIKMRVLIGSEATILLLLINRAISKTQYTNLFENQTHDRAQQDSKHNLISIQWKEMQTNMTNERHALLKPDQRCSRINSMFCLLCAYRYCVSTV